MCLRARRTEVHISPGGSEIIVITTIIIIFICLEKLSMFTMSTITFVKLLNYNDIIFYYNYFINLLLFYIFIFAFIIILLFVVLLFITAILIYVYISNICIFKGSGINITMTYIHTSQFVLYLL